MDTKRPGNANILPDRLWQEGSSEPRPFGRRTAPGHGSSPGIAHSPRAEVLPQQREKRVGHGSVLLLIPSKQLALSVL